MSKQGNNSNMAKQIKKKISLHINLIMLNTFTQTEFGNMWKTTVWPYVPFLVTAAMFFDRSKISTTVLCSKEKSFVKLTEKKSFDKLLMMTTTMTDSTCWL